MNKKLMIGLVAGWLAHCATARAAEDACGSKTGGDVLNAVAGKGHTVDALPISGFIATGSDTQIVVDQPYESIKDLAVRAVVEAPPGTALALLQGASIALRKIEPDSPLVTARRVANSATVATLRVPTVTWSMWDQGTIYLLACRPGADPPELIAKLTAPMSWRWLCAFIASAIVGAVYLLSATAVFVVDKARKAPSMASMLRWSQYLDPVNLTADVNRRGSLSKLQILFFSLVVSGLLSYIVLRAGVLSDLSPTVLLLLGISGVGAAASKGAEVSRSRLDFENWAWLIRKGWLPEGGLLTVARASWRDLVTTADEFDVYHFQMIVFSLVVGGALLATGLTDLASFKVPETLLGVLGLSQVVYIGGTLVAPPSIKNLNDGLNNLRDLEAEFVKVATITPDPTAVAPQVLLPAGDLESAKRRAAGAKSEGDRGAYSKYMEAAKNARVMFESVFVGRKVSDMQIEPSFA
jgi:hypothetical protein